MRLNFHQSRLVGVIFLIVCARLNAAPGIEFTILPGSAPSGQGYQVKAHGWDASGRLTKVNIWRNNSPFAFAGGGDGYNGDSENISTDHVPEGPDSTDTVTFEAQSEALDENGNVVTSARISVPVTIYRIQMSPPWVNGFPPFWINAFSSFAPGMGAPAGNGSGQLMWCVPGQTAWQTGSWTPPYAGMFGFMIGQRCHLDYEGNVFDPVQGRMMIRSEGYFLNVAKVAQPTPITIKVNGDPAEGQSFAYGTGISITVEGGNGNGGIQWVQSLPGTSPLPANTYTVSAYRQGDANYDPSSTASRTFTITKANQSIGLFASATSITAPGSITFTPDIGAGTGNYIWSGSGSGGWSYSASTPTQPGGGRAVSITFNTAGSYTVNVYRQGDGNYNQSNTASVSVMVNPPVYSLTVAGGSGSGSYTAGTNVGITANTITGYVFSHWSVSGPGSVASPGSSSTTFTMGGGAAAVTANYNQATYSLAVSNGSGSGTYTAGTQVTITANAPPAGQLFSNWAIASGVGAVASPTSATTTFTMTHSNATVQPVYYAPAPPVLVGLHAAGFGATGSFSIDSWLVGGSHQVTTVSGEGSGNWTPAHQYRPITPGLDYVVQVSGSTQRELRFEIPRGYTLFINDAPYADATTINLENVNGIAVSSVHFFIVANDGSAALRAGYAIDPQISSDDVIWAISLGRAGTGRAVGALTLRKTNVTGQPFSLDLLTITNPEIPGVLEIHSDNEAGGPWGYSRRFVYSPGNCWLWLDDRVSGNPATYAEIKAYDPSADPEWDSGSGTYKFKVGGVAVGPFARYVVASNAPTNDTITITKNPGAAEQVSWTLKKTTSGMSTEWLLKNGTQQALRTVSTVSGAVTTDEVTVEDGLGNVAQRFRKTHQDFGWGKKELISEANDPLGLNLITTYTYGTSGANYGKLLSVSNPDGTYTKYEYAADHANYGKLTRILSPWLDVASTAATAATTNARATTLTYSPVWSYLTDPVNVSTTTVPVGGAAVTVAKTEQNPSYTSPTFNGKKTRKDSLRAFFGSGTGDYLASTRVMYHPDETANDFANRLISETGANGAKRSVIFYKGLFTDNGDANTTLFKVNANSALNTQWGEYSFYGFSTAVGGSQLVNSFDGQTIDPVYLVPNRSFVDLVVIENGRPVRSVQYVFTGAAAGVPTFEFVGSMANNYVYNSATSTAVNTVSDHRGGTAERFFLNGRLTKEVGGDGTEVSYHYNGFGWAVRKELAGVSANGDFAAQSSIYTHYTYDSAGRELRRKVSNSTDPAAAGPENSYQYDTAGRLASETDASGLQASYSYNLAQRKTTVTFPGGATKIVETYADGSLKSITGTGVTAEYYANAVATDGKVTRTIYALRASDLANPTAAPRWASSTTDWLGRRTRVESPAASGGTIAVTYTYNTKGQLTTAKTVDGATGSRLAADALTEYDAFEVPYRSGADLDATAGLNVTSALDRISEIDTICEKDASGVWWLKTTTKLYNQPGSGAAITTSTAKQRLHKWATAGANVQAEAIATDLLGNQTRETVAVERANRLVTATVDLPDSSAHSVNVVRNGLLVRAQSASNLASTYAYDSLRRLVASTNPRIDGTTLAHNLSPRIGYHDGTASVGARYQMAWSKDAVGNQTNFSYANSTGYLIAVQDPGVGGQPGKFTRYDYTQRGELYRQWGHVPYPSESVFNDYGETVMMKTFRGGDATTWNQASWPATPATADLTKWIFDPATGVLQDKYDAANLDASGQPITNAKKVSYTYNKLGQLKTRTWARGVLTTYKYFGDDSGDPLTAELKSIDYSNTTSNPDVSFAFNRAGQTASVADAAGNRTFVYSPTTAVLQTETLPALQGGRVRTLKYDTAGTGTLGRSMGFSLGTTGSPTADYDVTYGYDGYGRPNSVATGGVTFGYGYTANSDLIASVNEATSGWSQLRTWVSNRSLLDKIETKIGTSTVVTKAAFKYEHDELGRRTSVVQSGELFNRYVGQGLVTRWGYNDRSETTSIQTFHGQTLADVSYPVAGRNYAFEFDHIGNRKKSRVDDRETTYSVNNLNQLKARTTPGKVEVSGLAPTASTVQANGQAVTRQGDYYHQAVDVSNASAALNATVTVTSSTTPPPGNSVSRKSFVAKASLTTAEQWQYDDDGNITRDDQWSYTWDAENRLVAIETRAEIIGFAITSLDARRLEFTYDYLSRRVRKLVRSGWNGSTFSSSPDTDTRFIYNGWNLVGEYDALPSIALKRTFTWGLDYSGSSDGAGGVGGLLMSREGSTDYVYAYDGNGNIVSVMNRTGGATVAEYEYSPFGDQIRATGSYAQNNPFRFSTQYFDVETKLVCYHRRYYDPRTGRWLSRDPIEERGGLNLYGFVSNNSVNGWDVRGMCGCGGFSGFRDASMDADDRGYGGCGGFSIGIGFGGGRSGGGGTIGVIGARPGSGTGTGTGGPAAPAVGPVGNSAPGTIAPPDSSGMPPTTVAGTTTPSNPNVANVVAATNASVTVAGGNTTGPNPPGTTQTTANVGATAVVGNPVPSSPTPVTGSIPSPVSTPSPADNRVRSQVSSGATGRYSPDAQDVLTANGGGLHTEPASLARLEEILNPMTHIRNVEAMIKVLGIGLGKASDLVLPGSGRGVENVIETGSMVLGPGKTRTVTTAGAAAAQAARVAAAAAARANAGRKLGKALKNAGYKRYPGDEAHHIVAFGDEAADPARKILEKHGIDINSANNGVFLPGPKGVPNAPLHRPIHTDSYHQQVIDRLQQADGNGGKEAVLEALESIRQGILDGTFP